MEALPEFDGLLIARKGEGWEEEFERFIQYAFASQEKGCSNGIASFVAAQIWRLKKINSDKIPILQDEDFDDFSSFLKIQVLQTWGDTTPFLNYEIREGISFLNFVFGFDHIFTLWKQFCSSREHLKHYTDYDDEFWDWQASSQQESWSDLYKQILKQINAHVQNRISQTDFPIDVETMTGVQFYEEYNENIEKQPIGLQELKRVTIQAIKKCHTDDDGNQTIAPENLLLNYHVEAKKALTIYREENMRGGNDPENGEYILDVRKKTSVRSKEWNILMIKTDAWSLLCPIHTPEALNDLLSIPIEKCCKFCNQYLNFIARVIFPDSDFKNRDNKKVIPTNF